MTGRVVHLELHSGDLESARAFYSELCGWRPELISTCGKSYLALTMGSGIDGGIVECATPRPVWLPYVEVPDIAAVTEQARRLGAAILLPPREGPAGWRSVVRAPGAGEVAFWQPKR